MSDAITAIFCTLVLAAGWYYLARSEGVTRLQTMESPRRNATRRRARRMGAWAMIALGLGAFWMMWELQRRSSPARLGLSLLVVGVALATMLLTVAVDVYLTARMRRSHRPPK